jgi:hypothetical protein
VVEFALVLPLGLMIIAFLLALGLRYFWAALSDSATRAAARYASVQFPNGCYPMATTTPLGGPQNIRDHTASSYAGMLGTPTVTVTNTGRVNKRGSAYVTCYGSDYGSGVFPAGHERCGQEGDIVAITTTWHVPGLGALQGLTNAVTFGTLDVTGLATVQHTATARCE